MQIGSKEAPPIENRNKSWKKVNEMMPQELRDALKVGDINPDWNKQIGGDFGPMLPEVPNRHGDFFCKNNENPDPDIPAELFNFTLILNSRKFHVVIDRLIRINTEEDLAEFSEEKLREALEQCAAYRLTCFCAYVAAKREQRKWDMYQTLWMAERREEARKSLRIERIADKTQGLRKEIGQITNQEIDDWIISHYTQDYKQQTERIKEWEENAETYLELRDTLKDRGMHLQTLLKRVGDHTDPNRTSSGAQY